LACPAEFALVAISELVAGTPGEVAGQSTTTPDATAAAAMVEPVTAIVIFEGLLCRGVLRRRGVRDKMSPWSGARRALGFHPGHCRAAGEAGAGSGVQTKRGVRATSLLNGSRHARRVLSAIHHAEESSVLTPEPTWNPYDVDHSWESQLWMFAQISALTSSFARRDWFGLRQCESHHTMTESAR
jgi:hypothetical protein